MVTVCRKFLLRLLFVLKNAKVCEKCRKRVDKLCRGGGYNKKNCLWRHVDMPPLQTGAREDEYGEVPRVFAFPQKMFCRTG